MKLLKMKNKILPYFVLFFMNLGIILSIYFYPAQRDEFYYLDKIKLPNFFVEYYQYYLNINPRIGQLFFNIVARIKWLKILMGILVFNGYILMIYLNVYRIIPDFKIVENVKKYLVISLIFIFLINYFGEMFYYSAFFTNYSFTHIFHLLFIYIVSEYFVLKNNFFLNNKSSILLAILGLFVGMSNEHIPPVLLLLLFCCCIERFIFQKQKIDYKIFLMVFFTMLGYIFLYFAPSQSKRYGSKGSNLFGHDMIYFFENYKSIIKTFYYYNFELIVVLFVFLIIFFLFKRNRINVFLLISSCVSILVLGISPLIGTRLLLFSNTLFIIFIINQVKNNFSRASVEYLTYFFLLGFFVFSIYVTFNADKNYHNVMNEIASRSKTDKDVVLKETFNYNPKNVNNWFYRKIFLENSKYYIDSNPNNNTSIEWNIIQYYKLSSLKVRN